MRLVVFFMGSPGFPQPIWSLHRMGVPCYTRVNVMHSKSIRYSLRVRVVRLSPRLGATSPLVVIFSPVVQFFEQRKNKREVLLFSKTFAHASFLTNPNGRSLKWQNLSFGFMTRNPSPLSWFCFLMNGRGAQERWLGGGMRHA